MPADRSSSRSQGRPSDRNSSSSSRPSRPSSGRPASGSRDSSSSRGASASGRSTAGRSSSSRPGSSRPSSGSFRDGATSGGRTASGRDSTDRSSFSGRSTAGRSTDRRDGTGTGNSSREERTYGSRGGSSSSRPSSDRSSRPSEGRSYGDRDSRPSSRPSSDRPAGRSYGDRDSRPSSDRPSRPGSSRPSEGRSYGDRDSRPPRSGSDRPSRPSEGRSYGDRDSRPSSRPSSDRPAGRSYGDRDSRPSSRPSEGRSYGDRDSRPSTDRPRRSNPFGGDRPKASDDRGDRSSSRFSERGGRPDRAGGRFADDREERPRGRVGEKRVNVLDPIIPDHITGEELPRAVRNELRTLPEGLALRVARHLAASVEAATVNPEISWQHAKAALSKASRVGIIREAAAEAAYNAGHFAEALIEFRAARRMRGIKEYWPLMADCERACGRPMKAIEMAGDPLVKNLDHASRIEMRIVAAGARLDMGNKEAALATLQCPDLTANSAEPWAARIRYTYADVLEQMGRPQEALEWFHRAAAVDADMLTDSDQRIRKLEGKSSDLDTEDGYLYDDLEDLDDAEDYIEEVEDFEQE